MVLSYELPNLTTLNTESLNGFLEQCQQKGLDDNRVVHQISKDIKYLIRTKLKNNPTLSYSIAQNYNWENQMPIIELLQHCKAMVTHGKQSNDSMVQTALKQIRFGINLSDVSSVDKITLNIRNTLMRDLPPEARANPLRQQC